MPPNKAQLDIAGIHALRVHSGKVGFVVRTAQLRALRRSSLLNYGLGPIVARPRERLSLLAERCGTYRKIE